MYWLRTRPIQICTGSELLSIPTSGRQGFHLPYPHHQSFSRWQTFWLCSFLWLGMLNNSLSLTVIEDKKIWEAGRGEKTGESEGSHPTWGHKRDTGSREEGLRQKGWGTRAGNREKEEWEQSVPETATMKPIILYANLKKNNFKSQWHWVSVYYKWNSSVSSGKENIFWQIFRSLHPC